jgi:hypothetical protein
MRHGSRRAVTWVAVLGMALLLAACSSLKLGYNNADTLLVYSLDTYLDLDDTQEKLARERVRELLAWHRSTQLTQYAHFLDETERKVGHGHVNADDVLAFQRTVTDKMMKVGEHSAPDLARLALTLQPAQVNHLAEKLAKDTAKARREFTRSAGKETLEHRVKLFSERAESWFGPLNKEQLALVRASLATRPAGQQQWLDERELRQREAVALLNRIVAEKPSEIVAANWLRAYFAQLAEPGDEARRAAVAESRRNNAQLVAQLINTTTPTQKAALSRKLRGYSQDFSTLASATGGRG